MRHTGASEANVAGHALTLAYVDGHVKLVRLTATFRSRWTLSED